jgi:outer membrane protein OmpA-like peptidoglycan-associated protein
MRKLLPFFFGVLTLVWLVGGTVWYRKNYCDVPMIIQPSPPTVSIKEGTQTLSVQTPIVFSFADDRPLFMSESIVSLKKAADEITDNRYKSLVIKGYYSSKEKKLAPSVDLGLKRAEAIRKVLQELGALDNDIELQSMRSENLHFMNNQLQDGVEFEIIEDTNKSFEALNFNFPSKKFRFKETKELEAYFKNLKDYLEINPTTNIEIKAIAHRNEGKKFSERRIDFLKDYMIDNGVDLKRFAFKISKVGTKNAIVTIRKT